MALLLADECFRFGVVLLLRQAGHDVVTAQAEGLVKQPDDAVLQHATRVNRAVLTFNSWDFVRLHSRTPQHAGIIVCSEDDTDVLARRIDEVLTNTPDLANLLIRIYKAP